MSEAANPDLEHAIRADPSAVEPYLVYGDWLQSQGDPRGELIAVQHQRAGEPDNEELRQAEQRLLQQNVAHFFGPPQPGAEGTGPDQKISWLGDAWAGAWRYGYMALVWRRGFVRKLRFDPGYYADDGGSEDGAGERCVAMLSRFLAHPSARFIEEIVIGDIWADYSVAEGPDLGLAAAVIVESPVAPLLRLLEFVGGDHDISGVMASAVPIWAACPRLERLALYAGSIDLGQVRHERLKSLVLCTGGLTTTEIKAVVDAELPALEELELWFGDSYYGASGGIDDIRPILDGERFPGVRRLGLKNAEFSNDICQALPTARILPQLEVLDLSMGTLDDEGAAAIVENKEAFAHLSYLDLSDSFLSEAIRGQLAGVCVNVATSGQKGGPDEDRYVSVGE
jgi:uncharacterized protein (TIGR02996 family)